MRIIILSILILSSIQTALLAQSTMGKINIASPNAAALGKYGDIPVSYHTGVPNIGIPIYTIKEGSIAVPMNLSYHAGGIRSGEAASWVGLGWNLNIGGAITRTVKDKPDERRTGNTLYTKGYFSDYGFADNPVNPSSGNLAAPESLDVEPDLFSFSCNGQSGKFFFNDDRTPTLVPEQDVKIEYKYVGGAWTSSPGGWSGYDRCIDNFKITFADGTKYYFGIPDVPVNSPYCEPIEVISNYTSGNGSAYGQVISSWYLYKIESASGNFVVNFNYIRDKFATYAYINEDRTNNYALLKNYTAGVRLSKVTSSLCTIDFLPGSPREDLSGWNLTDIIGHTEYANTTSPALGSIVINDNTTGCFKKIQFTYDYFVDNTTGLLGNFSAFGIISDKKKLKLMSVQEKTCNDEVVLPPYNFEYFTELVPRSLSFAKDHWGFNNGAVSNTGLYPLMMYNNGTMSLSANMNLNIANRDPAWPAMRAGTLNQISYPTGGKTSFEFESHRSYIIQSGVNVEKTIGGLRIKKIDSYDPVTQKTLTQNFSYTEFGGVSSGILYSIPTYAQVYRNDLMKKTFYWGGANKNGCLNFDDSNTVVLWANPDILISDNPIRPMETTQGAHIGYREVKVEQTGNGYSIYKFATIPTQQINRKFIALTNLQNPINCTETIPSSPDKPLQYSFNRGEMIYEGVYNNSGLPLTEKEILNEYSINPVTIPGIAVSKFNGTRNFGIYISYYEIQTGRMTNSIVQQKQYDDAGNFVSTISERFFESQYHHQPTRTLVTDTKGRVTETKMKYAFDYRVPTFDNTLNCTNASTNFMGKVESAFSANSAAFLACGGHSAGGGTCFRSTLTNTTTSILDDRKSYVACRRTNYTNTSPLNTYQVNHDIAKNVATGDLKTILWMQDAFMNAPIETTVWQSNKLISASYSQYNNNRDDLLGIYPEKTFKIKTVKPIDDFAPSSIAANNASIIKDIRYKEIATGDFNKGNIINIKGRDGVDAAYQWGYNENMPIVSIVNAQNLLKEQITAPVVGIKQLNFTSGQSTSTVSFTQNFTRTEPGKMIIKMPTAPPGLNVKLTGTFNISGPASFSNIVLCSTSGSSCLGAPSSIDLPNMPVGNYTFNGTVVCTFGGSTYTFSVNLSYTYDGLQSKEFGTREFFYENFESSSYVTGLAHTGTRYSNNGYSVNYVKPNSRNYTIQWWSLNAGLWQFNQQAYTGSMTLTGSIDDVRIFPSDALMTTYAYHPLIGMTASTDPNGKTTYFDFDKIGRLINIKDNKGDIVKNYFYNYGAAPATAPALISFTIANRANVAYNTTFTNRRTGQVFTKYCEGGNCLIDLPPDPYDVVASPANGVHNLYFGICGLSYTGNTAIFGNVEISATCNKLDIKY